MHPMHSRRASFMATVIPVILLLIWSSSPVAARLLFQQNATIAAATNTTSTAAKPKPSPLSLVYDAQTFANNPNFTFLPGYTTNVTGQPGTLDYTIQLINPMTGSNISAWHDIPLDLTVDGNGDITLFTVVEIPTGEQAKYETQVNSPG